MRSIYVLLALSLAVNPNSVQCERERLLRVATGTLRAANALLGYLLSCRKRKTMCLCELCEPWLPVEPNRHFDASGNEP